MVLGLFEDSQQPIQQLPQLTPATLKGTQLAYDMAQAATPESEQAASLQGVEGQSRPFLPSAEGISQRAGAMGMLQPSGLSQAIANRAQRHYESDLNHIQRQSALESTGHVVEKQNLATHALMQKQAYDQAVYHRQVLQYQNEMAARNAAISSILGAAGAVGGALIGGGPGGAVAGASIGGGLVQGNKQQQTL